MNDVIERIYILIIGAVIFMILVSSGALWLSIKLAKVYAPVRAVEKIAKQAETITDGFKAMRDGRL